MDSVKSKISLAAFVLGFSAMASQIVFLRSFFSVFSGNEMTIGVVIGFWLLSVAFGSAFLGRSVDRVRNKTSVISAGFFILAFLLPFGILEIGIIRPVFGFSTGEIIRFFPIFLSSGVILLPICGLFGLIFVLLSGVFPSRNTQKAGFVYFFEAIGSLVGGLSANFIFIRIFNPLETAIVAGIFCLIASVAVVVFSKKQAAKLAIVFLFAYGIFSGKFDRIYRREVQLAFPYYKIADMRSSIYGKIVLAEKEGQFSLFYDGNLLFTFGDKKTAENSVYFGLLQRKNLERVLLIGGGIDAVKEILKYGVKKVDYVELDPEVIKATEKIFPSARGIFVRKVNVSNTDARYFVKNARGKYDCVIMSAPPPFSIRINRFYTVEFFKDVKKILRPGGVFSFGLPSSENYINNELRALLSSVYFSLKSVFGRVVIVPGFTAYFIVSNGGKLTDDWRVLTGMAKKKKLKLIYFRDYFLSSRMSPEKIKWMKKTVSSFGKILNRDSRPLSCYFSLLYWMSHFSRRNISKFVMTKSVYLIGFSLFFLLLFAFVFRGSLPRAVASGIFATGFSSMAGQIAVLFVFQIVRGFLFYKLGLLLTLFMAGLSAGSFLSLKKRAEKTENVTEFLRVQELIFLIPFAIAFFFYGSLRFGGIFPFILFYFLPPVEGFLCGKQFPLANVVLLSEEVSRTSGFVYGMDVAGACLAAFFSGIFFIPLLGIYGFCVFTAFLNGIALILLFSYNKRDSI